jgi:hypothetical protein
MRWKKEARPADVPRSTCTDCSTVQAIPREEREWWRKRRAMSRPAGQMGLGVEATRDDVWAKRQIARMLRRVRRWIARGEVPW